MCRESPLKVSLIRRHGHGVAALVLGMAGVAADVGEADAMAGEQSVEPPPEVFVFHLGPAAAFAAPPAVCFHLGIHSVRPLPT